MPKMIERSHFPLEGGALQGSYKRPLWPFSASDRKTCDELKETSSSAQEAEHLRAEIRRLESQVATLEELAHRESLLDIPNRRCFFASLERAIAEVDRDGVSCAMLFVDLNRLKEINDTFGHNAGDEALIATVDLLVNNTPPDGCVARLGGDEFGILLKQTDEQNAYRAASRICAAVNVSALSLAGSYVPLSIAIGVAMIKPGADPKLVVEQADKEMYRMKSQGTLGRQIATAPLSYNAAFNT